MPVPVNNGRTPERLFTVGDTAELLPATTAPPSIAEEKGERP